MPTISVLPPIKLTAAWRVRAVDVVEHGRLRVTFVDGLSGDVELRSMLGSARVTGTMFEALRDPAFFARVEVVLGALQWPNGSDLAPDAMYDAIRKERRWEPA